MQIMQNTTETKIVEGISKPKTEQRVMNQDTSYENPGTLREGSYLFSYECRIKSEN